MPPLPLGFPMMHSKTYSRDIVHSLPCYNSPLTHDPHVTHHDSATLAISNLLQQHLRASKGLAHLMMLVCHGSVAHVLCMCVHAFVLIVVCQNVVLHE